VALRGIFIFTGVALVERFAWLLAGFGAFLLYTGCKALREELAPEKTVHGPTLSFDSIRDSGECDEDEVGPPSAMQSHLLLQMLSTVLPLSPVDDNAGRFFVRVDTALTSEAPSCPVPRSALLAALYRMLTLCGWVLLLPLRLALRALGLHGYSATPLFAALVVIETTDVMFAADSIPAVLSITRDPFIAYTSNIFAVLGLRALYFALAAAMTQFVYLGTALGAILVFIGLKLLGGLAGMHVSIEVTLCAVLGTLGAGVVLSLIKARPLPPALDSSFSV
jgi:predicted tellurium resistance membrane protein TerC